MKENREFAFEVVVQVEGRYVDDPLGGPTKFGVTLATAQKLGFDMDKDGDIDADDIKLLTIVEAKQAFYRLYWDVIRADDLPNGHDVLAADLAYNSGPGRVAKLYDADFWRFVYNRQRWYNTLNKNPKNQWAFAGWCNRLDTVVAKIEERWPEISKQKSQAQDLHLEEVRALVKRLDAAIEPLLSYSPT